MHEKSLYSYRKHDLCSSQHPFVIIIIAGNSWFQFLLFFNCIFFYIYKNTHYVYENKYLSYWTVWASCTSRLKTWNSFKRLQNKDSFTPRILKRCNRYLEDMTGVKNHWKAKEFQKTQCGLWAMEVGSSKILQNKGVKPLIKILRSFLIYYLFLTLIFYSLFLKKKRKKACVLSPLFPV